jgi:hypothetical protein
MGNPLEANFPATTRVLDYVTKRISLSAQHFGNAILGLKSLEEFQAQVKQNSREKKEGSIIIEGKVGDLRGELSVIAFDC